MKAKKGDFGYIRREKKKRILTTLILFAIPLAAFVGGVLVTGTNQECYSQSLRWWGACPPAVLW